MKRSLYFVAIKQHDLFSFAVSVIPSHSCVCVCVCHEIVSNRFQRRENVTATIRPTRWNAINLMIIMDGNRLKPIKMARCLRVIWKSALYRRNLRRHMAESKMRRHTNRMCVCECVSFAFLVKINCVQCKRFQCIHMCSSVERQSIIRRGKNMFLCCFTILIEWKSVREFVLNGELDFWWVRLIANKWMNCRHNLCLGAVSFAHPSYTYFIGQLNWLTQSHCNVSNCLCVFGVRGIVFHDIIE